MECTTDSIGASGEKKVPSVTSRNVDLQGGPPRLGAVETMEVERMTTTVIPCEPGRGALTGGVMGSVPSLSIENEGTDQKRGDARIRDKWCRRASTPLFRFHISSVATVVAPQNHQGRGEQGTSLDRAQRQQVLGPPCANEASVVDSRYKNFLVWYKSMSCSLRASDFHIERIMIRYDGATP